jgi:uncharacterized membrane protein YccF (DUF307 family)
VLWVGRLTQQTFGLGKIRQTWSFLLLLAELSVLFLPVPRATTMGAMTNSFFTSEWITKNSIIRNDSTWCKLGNLSLWLMLFGLSLVVRTITLVIVHNLGTIMIHAEPRHEGTSTGTVMTITNTLVDTRFQGRRTGCCCFE